MAQLIVIVAMFVLLWLFFIRPQRQRAQAQQQLVSGIEVGDEILTVGGIYGTVLDVQDGDLVIEIAPGTRVRAARRAVAAVMPDDEEQQELEEGREGESQDEIRS